MDMGLAVEVLYCAAPNDQPRFILARHEGGQKTRYETRAYVMDRPEGARYG